MVIFGFDKAEHYFHLPPVTGILFIAAVSLGVAWVGDWGLQETVAPLETAKKSFQD